jgi:hypothetical protein
LQRGAVVAREPVIYITLLTKKIWTKKNRLAAGRCGGKGTRKRLVPTPKGIGLRV